MTPQPANETLKLQVGEVYTIALAQATGKPVRSQFTGDQMMYSLIPTAHAPWSRTFVDLYVDERIRALGVGPNEPFEIEKIERRQGNQRVVEVVVRKTGGAGVRTAPAPVNAGYRPPSLPHAAAPPQVPQLPPAPVNGAGESHADIMARCYCSAVDIALATIACAEKKGLRLTAQFEDVRAMGTALLIAETGRR